MTLPFDHICNLDLEFSRSKLVWYGLISGMGVQIDVERKPKACESIIHDIDIDWPWWGRWMCELATGVTWPFTC